MGDSCAVASKIAWARAGRNSVNLLRFMTTCPFTAVTAPPRGAVSVREHSSSGGLHRAREESRPATRVRARAATDVS